MNISLTSRYYSRILVSIQEKRSYFSVFIKMRASSFSWVRSASAVLKVLLVNEKTKLHRKGIGVHYSPLPLVQRAVEIK